MVLALTMTESGIGVEKSQDGPVASRLRSQQQEGEVEEEVLPPFMVVHFANGRLTVESHTYGIQPPPPKGNDGSGGKFRLGRISEVLLYCLPVVRKL